MDALIMKQLKDHLANYTKKIKKAYPYIIFKYAIIGQGLKLSSFSKSLSTFFFFDKFVKEIKIERDVLKSPTFNLCCAYQIISLTQTSFPNIPKPCTSYNITESALLQMLLNGEIGP